MAEYSKPKGYISTPSGTKSTNRVDTNHKWDNADQKGQDFTRAYGNTTAATRVDPNHCSLAGDPDPANRGGLGTFGRGKVAARFPTKGR